MAASQPSNKLVLRRALPSYRSPKKLYLLGICNAQGTPPTASLPTASLPAVSPFTPQSLLRSAPNRCCAAMAAPQPNDRCCAAMAAPQPNDRCCAAMAASQPNDRCYAAMAALQPVSIELKIDCCMHRSYADHRWQTTGLEAMLQIGMQQQSRVQPASSLNNC